MDDDDDDDGRQEQQISAFCSFSLCNLDFLSVCCSLRYMGIGLSAQGVNMNRLPGKTAVGGCGQDHVCVRPRLPSVCVFVPEPFSVSRGRQDPQA